MAALLQGLKNMFTGTRKTASLENAYAAQNLAKNVNAAKQRICGMLEEKAKGQKLDLPEARYFHQHCNKSRADVNAVIDPLFKVTPDSPPRIKNFMNRALSKVYSPIAYDKYPSGGKRKTHKQKRKHTHTKKQKHTRKH